MVTFVGKQQASKTLDLSGETLKGYESNPLIPLDQEQYIVLLHEQMSENLEGTIYFSLLDQENYLYEYEGDLEEAIQDLPEIYGAISVTTNIDQSAEPNIVLSSEAAAVVEQLWDYFDRTGEQALQGMKDYNFQMQNNQLFVVPKDNTQEFFAIS